MKKTIYIFTIIALMSTHNSANTTPVDQKTDWQEFAQKNSISLGFGIPLGSITGYINALYLNRYQDPGKFRILLSWFIAHITHTEITQLTEKSMSEHSIPHSKDTMKWSAWLTSWLIYLKTRKLA